MRANVSSAGSDPLTARKSSILSSEPEKAGQEVVGIRKYLIRDFPKLLRYSD